jgi:hypothetical protein
MAKGERRTASAASIGIIWLSDALIPLQTAAHHAPMGRSNHSQFPDKSQAGTSVFHERLAHSHA